MGRGLGWGIIGPALVAKDGVHRLRGGSLTSLARKSSSTVRSLMAAEELVEEEEEWVGEVEEVKAPARGRPPPVTAGRNPERSLRARVGWSGRASRVYQRLCCCCWPPGTLPGLKVGRGLRSRRLQWRIRRGWEEISRQNIYSVKSKR